MYSSSSNSGDINLQISSKRKRKSDRFTKVNKDGVAEVIEPHWKEPKLSHFSFVETKLSEKSNNCTGAKKKDMLWVISFNLFNFVPMWTEWNIKRSENNPAKHVI